MPRTYLKKRFSLLRIFYFLSDFSEENGLSAASCRPENLTEEDYLLILQRFHSLQIKIITQLDEFYEEAERFKKTGSFEIVWDDLIFDPDDR